MALRPRDIQLLETLACKVRLLSLDQLSRAWWSEGGTPAVHARRRLRELIDSGWLYRTSIHAGPILTFENPLVRWEPGEAPPNAGSVARQLVERWTSNRPPRYLTVFAATAQSLRAFGGPDYPKRLDVLHATHDLNVGALFLRFRTTRPEDAEAWVGEDLRPKAGYRLKDPDAIIEYEGSRSPLIIEFGGKYDERTVRAFHEDCARRGRRYEFW